MPIKRTPEFFKGARLKVGVIGCGYVGLPLGLRFAEAGHAWSGFDTDPSKVEKLNRGPDLYRAHTEHENSAIRQLQTFLRDQRFLAPGERWTRS